MREKEVKKKWLTLRGIEPSTPWLTVDCSTTELPDWLDKSYGECLGIIMSTTPIPLSQPSRHKMRTFPSHWGAAENHPVRVRNFLCGDDGFFRGGHDIY